MQSGSAYLFLELAILVYAIGFGWELWDFRHLASRAFLKAAMGLAVLWFALDLLAVWLGLWTFPAGTTLPLRIFWLPLEEYLLFILHIVMCFLFIQRYHPSVYQ